MQEGNFGETSRQHTSENNRPDSYHGKSFALGLFFIILLILIAGGSFFLGMLRSPRETPFPSPRQQPTSTPLATFSTPTSTPTSSPTPTPLTFQAVTVAAAVSPTSSNSCPETFNFSGTITVNAAGAVTYKWERSDGATSQTQSLTFAGASTKTVNTTWTLSSGGTKWEKLRVLTPNDITSNEATFTLDCP